MENSQSEKQRFESRFQNLNISREEMDRRYRQHLSEQFERERLGMMVLMEAARGAGESASGSAIGGGTQEETQGLVITSQDFTTGNPIYQDTTTIGTNGNEGFDNTAAQGNLIEGYYGQGMTSQLVDALTAIYTGAGLDPNNTDGYMWNATWGAGSSITTGLIKFGFSPGGSYFYLQTVDPADPDWELPGSYNGTSLAGTFLFPLTISLIVPTIDKAGWC